MLTKISNRFRLDASNNPSSEAEIDELRDFSQIPVPDDYIELIRERTELEFAIDGGKYIRIWGALGCIEMNTAYDIQKNLGKSLAIGDDEGGSALVLLPEIPGVRSGLYLIGFGCLDVEEADFIANSLEDLLVREMGIEILK